ncbi:YadA-like family protein [Moraxella ovis]|uniref:YadA-like family protein n=1 Tax=Moraxella ovis TaxID=29433 RepID=UPI000DFBF539|nr:YadA-like family protein [Moraxella ovis]STZ06156.1 chromosome segregation protein SMC [Moraxella ovis]
MNKIFKVKRNSLGQSVVCSEIATSRSKCRVIASALALTIASSAMAQGQVKSEFINTNDVRATFIGTEALTGEEMLSSYSDSDSDNVITPDTLLKTANYIGKTDQTLPQKALNDFHIENLQTDLDDANINLQNIFDWAHQAYETIEDHHAALDGVGDIVSALSATDDVLIDEIAENTNDIFKLAVISETTVDEVAKNRAALEAHTDSINELGVATNVLIDEIAENTNDIFKLAVISETTVDEVAKNRAALEAHTDSINELGVATNVLIDEIAENTNDIFKLAVISETTVDEVAKNRAALEAHTDSINELGVATNVLIDEIAKNQADIATLMSKSPAAVDLQPINDKIDALSSNVDGKINKLNEKLSAGVAGSVALAMMPAPAAGSQYITGGTGFYNGESAIALGFTGASETGKFTYKLGGSLTSSGSGTFGAGAGYRWR